MLQNYLDLENKVEVIVVDSSTDEISLPAGIQYFRITNNGPSYARNYGVSKASGDWVLFCDADDLINPHIIKQLALLTGETTDAVFFDFKREDDSRIVSAVADYYHSFQLPSHLQIGAISNPVLFLQKFFPVHAVLFRRKIFEKITFNESQWFIEDVRFYLELALIPGIQMQYCSNEAFHSFHREFTNRQSLSASNELLFWEGVHSNYHYLATHGNLSVYQKFKLVKLLLLNYHIVPDEMKKSMEQQHSIIWNYFLSLPKLLKNRLLFKAVISITRIGR